MAEEKDAAVNLPTQCLQSLRRSVRELSAGMPVSALAALMAAQSAYGRYALGGGFSLRTLNKLQVCIRSVEDKVYPVITLRQPPKENTDVR